MDASDIPATAHGLYQYIIGGMASIITALAGANVWQYKSANSVTAARLEDTATLHKTLADVNATLAALSATSQRRNDVMDKLGELISQISVAMKLLTDRLEIQHEHTNKDLEDAVKVTASLAEAVRAVASRVDTGFAEVKAKL